MTWPSFVKSSKLISVRCVYKIKENAILDFLRCKIKKSSINDKKSDEPTHNEIKNREDAMPHKASLGNCRE